MTIPDDNWQPPFVNIETTFGTIQIELYWKHAPLTCRNFAELARRGYYNGNRFHRVIRNFLVQSGDPTGTGRGGASIYPQRHFDDEIHALLKHTGAGVVSMANSGRPNTNGSQFFITLAPAQKLDGRYAIFGRVRQGIQVLDRIGKVDSDKFDRPTADIKLVKVYPIEELQ